MEQFQELWHRIENFELDIHDANYSFSQRLAFENNWSHSFAKRVIIEYKKFICLSVFTQKPLTPSDEVDQAWHLHLIYSRSYWHDLFRDLLDHKGIHHGPTKGGEKENLRYNEQYENTLKTYRDYFGPEPKDIWPIAEIRFGNSFKRISTKDNMIINKNKIKQNLKVYVPIALAFLAGLLMSAETKKKEDDFSIFWLLLIVAGGIFLIRGIYRYCTRKERYTKSGSSSGSSDSGADGIFSSFFGCGSSGSGCSSSSGCASSGCSGCGGGGCGGCGGCGS